MKKNFVKFSTGIALPKNIFLRFRYGTKGKK
jgi:hypothetical protein